MSVSNNVMASFGDGFVETQVISENNAVKYKLDFAGSNRNSTTNAYCTLNDKALGDQNFNTGLNTRLITEAGALVESKYFDIKNASGASSAFINYINGLKAGQILIIISNNEIGSTKEIDTLMDSIGTQSWPGTDVLNKYPSSSYSAVYMTTEKTICKEVVQLNDGIFKEDSRAYLMVVFDKLTDFGGTGYSKKLICDGETYSNSSDYEYKRYPTDSLVTTLPSLGSGTKIMYFSADLYASKELLDAGLTTRLTLRWMNGTNVASSTTFEVNKNQADSWIRKTSRMEIPSNATGYTAIASRYPSTANAKGESRVRNVVLSRVSRQFENLSRDAEFGVNGIRMNDLVVDSSDYDLELVDTGTDSSGSVYGKEFSEFQRF